MTKSTGGLVTLSGVNTLTGAMDITAGTLAVSGAGKLTSGAVTVSGASTVLTLGNTAQTVGAFTLVDGVVEAGTLSAASFGLQTGLVSAVLDGAGTVTKSTSGLVTLSGVNTLTGAMDITAGSLAVAGAGKLTSGAVTVNGATAVLTLGNTAQTVGAFTLAGGVVEVGTLSAASFGLQSGLVSAVLNGASTVTKSTGGLVTLSGANTLTGAMDVTAGSLAVEGAGKLTGGAVTVSGASTALTLGNTAQTVGAFMLVDGVVEAGTLSAASFGLQSGLVSAVLDGASTVTKSTGGLVTLSGVNTLTGAMNVTAGSLAVAGAGKLTSGAVTVSGASTVLTLGTRHRAWGHSHWWTVSWRLGR